MEVKATQSGVVIAVNDFDQECISFGVCRELVLAFVFDGCGTSGNGFGEATVEAFDHAIGLRAERFGQAMFDAVAGAHPVEDVASGGLPATGPADGSEAIRKFSAVVSEDGMDPMRKRQEEAFEASSDGVCVASSDDFDMHKAGRAIDGNEHEAGLALKPRQMFKVDVYEADGGFIERASGLAFELWTRRDTATDEAAVNGAAGELWVDAAAHGLDDIVES